MTESLAGRAAMLRLLPMPWRETEGRLRAALVWERDFRSASGTARGFGELWRNFLRGGYQELTTQPDGHASLWHANYIQTCLKRNIRNIAAGGCPDPVSELSSRADSVQCPAPQP